MTLDNHDRTLALVGEMERYYALRANIYDHSMGYDDPEFVRSLEPVIEALRAELKGRDLLEIACGPGFWTERVARVARLARARATLHAAPIRRGITPPPRA